jgi:GNAT superfamily N-acetyltransferase
VSLLIRPALPEEADQLQRLVRRPAAHPRIDAEYLARATVCAAWEGVRLAGFFAVERRAGEWWLAHLWVADELARRGRGRWLLTEAVRRARLAGAVLLRIAPEPEAEPFFRGMGAQAAAAPPGTLEIDLERWLEPLPESVSELGWSQ